MGLYTHTHTHTHTGTFIKRRISKNLLLLLILTIAIMIMGIGYSAIESVTGEIEGTVVAEAQNGIFITDVEYVSDVDANKVSSKINNFLGTMMQSTIELSKTNQVSEIKYKVTVHNNSTETVPFVGIVYDDDFYDNPNIIFEITQEGFQIGETIGPNETKEIFITFKYKNTDDGNVPENAILKSYLNFKMTEPNRMVLASNVGETGKYLTSTIAKNQIESIKFEQGKEPEYSDKIIERFDASEKQDESIIGYYTDEDNNGLYELTFVSQEIIYANKNAQFLFQNLINTTDIEFNNFSTLGSTNMRHMFSHAKKLYDLDLECFDTKDVTSMEAMFIEASSLAQLNLSKFNTINIKEGYGMYSMFRGCSSLKKLDLSNFNTEKVKTMTSMFYACSELTELNIKGFDTSNVISMQSMFSRMQELSRIRCK